MNRTVIGIGLTLALVIFLGVILMAYLALGSNGSDQERLTAPNLSGPGSITIQSGFDVTATDETDAYYLLGYAEGRERPWTLNLIRQTALGRLAEWFGDDVLPIDRLTRSLALASGARDAFKALPPDDAAMLRSFARGVADAFKTRKVIMDEQLVLFDVMPEPWEAWHTVAVERLFAWLSDPPVRPAPDDTAIVALEAFQRADESLRDWLHLHGFDHSSAWAFNDSSGTTVQAQYVYGASALPFLEPVRLTWSGTRVSGAAMLGTPYLTFSAGKGGVNAILASSPRTVRDRFAAGYPDSVETEERHERLVLSDGTEELLTVSFLGDTVFFGPGSFAGGPSSSTRWGSVAWPGVNSISDWPAWRDRMLQSAGVTHGTEPPFRLITGNGLSVTVSGEKSVQGRPVVVRRGASDSIYLAGHPLGSYAAERFERLLRAGAASTIATDEVSTWAEQNLPTALAALRPDSVYSPPVREAIDYLRNWDFRYDLASIGATIFDTWMGTLTEYREPYPTVDAGADSLARAQATLRLERALIRTVDSLTNVAGADPARWRLESFRRSERFFPAWSYAPLRDRLPSVDPRRYAPLSIRQPGHPTTLRWETGLFDYPFNSPAHVVASVGAAGAPAFSFRPDYQTGSGLIARHVVSAPGPLSAPFAGDAAAVKLTFMPAR